MHLSNTSTNWLPIAFLLVTGGAVAQTENQNEPLSTNSPEFRQFDRVEITGSSIVNPKARQALPVRVMERKEIERSGAQSTVDLLQRLPMMHSFTELGGFNPGAQAGGYHSGAIHGYERGTLVLINGRRVTPVALQRQDMDRTTSDLLQLPLSAIERIEILTDGASSLYGSDAIAGVINFITREETRGLQLQAQGSQISSAGKGAEQIGLSWGHGKKLQDGYNLQVHLEARKTPRLTFADLPWSNLAGMARPATVSGDPLYFTPWMTEYGDLGKLNKSVETVADCPTGYEYTLKRQSRTYQGSPVYRCQTPTMRHLDLYPQQNVRNAYAQFERWINDDVSVFAEWGQQNSETEYFYGRVQNAAVDHPSGRKVLIDLEGWAPQYRTQETTRQRWVVGSRGQLEAWHFKSSLAHSWNEDTYRLRGGFISGTNWNSLLAPYADELLSPLSQASSGLQSSLNARLLPDRTQRELRTALTEFNLTASTRVGETQWGDIQLGLVGFGTEQSFRYKSWDNQTDYPAYDRKRTNHGMAAELQVPAMERLDLVMAGRVDDYSDFGSVLTGKLGGKYVLTDQAYLRASTGTGFRAPTLSQMTAVSTKIGTNPDGSVAFATGNPLLQPEKSVQHSLGLHITPSPQWSTGLDWWSMRVKDSFGSWSVNQILTDPSLKSRYYSLVNGVGRYDIVSLNFGEMQKSGIDFHVTYRKPMDFGRLLIGLEGTHHLTSKRSLVPGGPLVSDLGTYLTDSLSLTPRNKMVLSTTLEMPTSGWRAALNFMSGNWEPYPNESLLAANGRPVGEQYRHRVKDDITLDVGGWYLPTPALKLSWFIRNITNTRPPERMFNSWASVTSTYYPVTDPIYTDYRGRMLSVALEWRIY